MVRLIERGVGDMPPRPPAASSSPGQRQHRLKPDQVQALITAYQAGALIKELASQFSIERRTVSEILARAGIERRRRGLAEAQIDEAIELYAQGVSLAKVGRQLGVDGETVRQQLLKRGVKMRVRNGC